MAFEDRTYQVVEIVGQSEAVLQTKFDNVKAARVLETSLATCRRSLDGTQMILKYVDAAAGPEIAAQWPPPKVIFTGTHTEMLSYLETNSL